jgi:preprotein translocase SecE subunit
MQHDVRGELTLAKATSKDKGATAHMRAPSTPVGAKAGTVRAAPDEEMRDDEELQPEESPDPEDIVEVDEEDEADEADASTELAVQSTADRSVTAAPSTSRAAVRPAGIPEPLMANPITRFIAESYLELRKVTWPTTQQAWTMTLIVIAMSATVAIILAAADFGLARFLTWVLNIGTGG